MFKKFNCFILSFLIVASLWPSTIKVDAAPLNEQSAKHGYVPSEVKIGRQESPFVKSINLPRRFDLREEGGVSTIKNQNPYGTCWSFATMGAIESNTKYTTGKELDLSEINLAVDRVGVDKLNDGGNYAMSANYFANWKGPVLEKDNPYPTNGQVVTPVNVPAAYHMQNSLLLPSRKDSSDNQYLKEAIMEKGAVGLTYFDADGYLGSDRKSYYYNGSSTSNHAVVIVGWDDDYPKERFSNTPAGNGAFIIKNSWGTSAGEEGYFYISYYDTSLGKDLVSVFQPLEQKDNYDNRYTYGNFNINYSVNGSPNDYFVANKYKTVNAEEVAAVSIYTFSTNVAYEVYIDEDYNAANYPSNNASYLINNKKVKSGILSYAGFNTIKLDKPIQVASGKSFLVGIKYKDLYSAPLEFNNSEGQNNTFKISGTTMSSVTNAANPIVAYTYNKSANDITAVNLDKSAITMGIGDKANLKATVTGSSTSNKEVLWSTSNPKIAVVDEDGVVTAKGNGQAIITASTRDGRLKSTATATVSSPLVLVAAPSKIGPQESIGIAFDDVIKTSTNYSGITLKDKSGNLLNTTISIDYKKLSVKLNSKYLGIAKLHIPSNAFANNSGKGLASDLDLDIVINNYNDSDLIKIGSSAISKAVAGQLSKAESAITAGEVRKITSLDIEADTIDLEDIWALESLQYLTLDAKLSSTNVQELKYLNSLVTLRTKNVKMINLNYLKDNKELYSIEIDGGELYSLEGIDKLQLLQNVRLANNNIRNISSISSLKKIAELDLSNNKLTDITPIKDCTSIRFLYLDNNRIANIDVLKGLTNLYRLYINRNKISDIKPLESLKNLANIDCSYNDISDISSMKTLSYNTNASVEFSINNNFIDPEDSNITYLKNTKGWNISCYDKKQAFYKMNYYKISEDILNSKRPITFTFSKGIKSVKSGDILLGSEFNNAALKYEIKGNKLIVHDEQIRSQSKPYNFYINLVIVDEDGNEQNIGEYIDITSTRSKYYSEDINKNGSVDITDIAQLAKDYNISAKGETQWNFDEDINRDGIIDIYDLTAVASQM